MAVEKNDVALLKALLEHEKAQNEQAAAPAEDATMIDAAAAEPTKETAKPAEVAPAKADADDDDDDDDEDDDGDFNEEEEEEEEASEGEGGGEGEDPDEEGDSPLDALDDSSLTPLHVALLHGSLDCLLHLLNEGADTGIGCEGSPLAHVTVSIGALPPMRTFAVEALRALMQHSGAADVASLQDDFRRTPLHLAADAGLVPMVDLLLSTFPPGSDPSPASYLLSKDRLGNTALHYACASGHGAAAARLLGAAAASGALSEVLTAANHRDELPHHHAVRMGAPGVLDALSKALSGGTGQALQASIYGLRDALGHSVEEDAAAYGKDRHGQPTLIVRSDVCERHFTCRPGSLRRGRLQHAPPENVLRLKVLTDGEAGGILRTQEYSGPTAATRFKWEHDPPQAQMADVLRVVRIP